MLEPPAASQLHKLDNQTQMIGTRFIRLLSPGSFWGNVGAVMFLLAQ